MVSWFVAIGSFGVAALGGSAAYVAYLLSRRWTGRDPGVERAVVRQRLDAYGEIMSTIVTLNRAAVDLGEMEFQEQADLMAYGEESKLSAAYGNVAEAYESNYHVISPAVREACSDYVDYLATYHDEGAQVGQLLSLSGSVAEEMRAEFDLEPLFPQDDTEE